MSVGRAAWRGTELEARIYENIVDYRRLLKEMWERQLHHAQHISFPYALDLGIGSQFCGNIGAKDPVTRREFLQFIRQEDKTRKIWRLSVPCLYPKGSKDPDTGEDLSGRPVIDKQTGLHLPHPSNKFGWPMVRPHLEKLFKYGTVLLFRSHRGESRAWLRATPGEDAFDKAPEDVGAAIGQDFAESGHLNV